MEGKDLAPLRSNSPEEAARYCTAEAVASLIESMKEDETLEIFGCEKDGAK
jgi:hypothetical protein